MWTFSENWIRMLTTDSVIASANIDGFLFLLHWSLLFCLSWCWRDKHPYLPGPRLILSVSKWLCYKASQKDASLEMPRFWVENPELPQSLFCTPYSAQCILELVGLALTGLLASLFPSCHWLNSSPHSARIGPFQESILLLHFLSIINIEILHYFCSTYRTQHIPFVFRIKMKYPCAMYSSSVSGLDLLISLILTTDSPSNISHVAFLLRYHYMIFHILLESCAYPT